MGNLGYFVGDVHIQGPTPLFGFGFTSLSLPLLNISLHLFPPRRKIKENVREQSYLGWFNGKIAISYSDSKRIEVSCTYMNKEWIEENYKSLIERLSGKKVSLVVIFRKKVKDGEGVVGAV